MSRKYALERGYLDRLRAGRRELLAYAREVKSADELRDSRDELMKTVNVYRTPKSGEQVQYAVVDGVARIPVAGQLTPSADPCGAWTGLAETEYGFIQAALIAAEDDPSVREIALDVDSPGGYITGLDETAQLLGAVSKPTTAYVGGMAASAAYWLASQADRIVALSPASEVGSIGVALEEYDDDQALADAGITHRVYTSTDAPNKRPDTKTEDGRNKVIAELDDLHSIFVRRVAEGRGVKQENVDAEFGQGGIVIAEKALAVGMIDEVRGSHIGRREKVENVGVASDKTAAGPQIKEVNKMTEQEIAALKAEAYQAGITAERKRVAELAAYSGKFGAAVDAIVTEAQATGKSYDEMRVQIDVAVMQAKVSGDNAPAVASAAAVADDLDDEDREAMKLFNLTAEQYRASKKGDK